jgi:hypothetical protein
VAVSIGQVTDRLAGRQEDIGWRAKDYIEERTLGTVVVDSEGTKMAR